MSLRFIAAVLALLLVIPPVLAASRSCTREIDPPRIDQSMALCADNYYPHNYPQGLNITADNIILDCGTSVLHGRFMNSGIAVVNRNNVTIRNCQVADYDIGILIRKSRQISIFNSNMIHNNIGIKVIDSSAVVVENSFDISIKRPLQLINSNGNVFHYVNKNMEGDECKLNQCNTPTGFAAKDLKLEKAYAPKKTLSRLLRDGIRSWLYPSRSVFSSTP